MSYPTAETARTFAGILTHLGWGRTYELKELHAAVDEYLASSDVDQEDRMAVHSNFIHTSIDHGDVLKAHYGCKAILAQVDVGHEEFPIATITYMPQ